MTKKHLKNILERAHVNGKVMMYKSQKLKDGKKG